jgi:hypothetical protein
MRPAEIADFAETGEAGYSPRLIFFEKQSKRSSNSAR